MSLTIRIREWWQWSYAQVIGFVYFHEVTLIGKEKVPDGPVLFLGTHRNGILDALVYSNVLGRMTFVLAQRLHKTLPGRILYGGIGVTRAEDGSDRPDRFGNQAALKLCRNYLVEGNRLFMFPEGTSSLGPRLLKIKPGAAKITMSALRARPDLKVVPVAVSYERAWGFRSRVEVRLGAPVALDDVYHHSGAEQFDIIQARIEGAMHHLASEFVTPQRQEACEIAANLRCLAEHGSHFDAVKTGADDMSPDLEKRWATLKDESRSVGAKRYNRIPLICDGPLQTHVQKLVGLGPFVVFMLLANAPILLGARFAAIKLADDTNVISLMRILVGLPLTILWGGATFAALAWAGQSWLWALSLALSLVGLGAYDTVRRSWAVLGNRHRSACYQEAYDAFRRAAHTLPTFA